MNRLLRATTLVGRPVVTIGGESPFEIKDVVFHKNAGRVLGFTLRKHGFLGGPVDEDLPWDGVCGLGPDAVMIADDGALTTLHGFDASGGDVIGDRVLTESGTDLGEIVEVIVEAGRDADVVGFEIEATDALRHGEGNNRYLPIGETVAISGEKIIVPDATVDYVRDDLSGFGGAVTDFRSRLGEAR